MTTTIYGIKNCDSMKKAFTWLKEAGVAYEFHDYARRGIDEDTLKRWAAHTGWEKLINTKGLTWRGLSDAEKSNLYEARAYQLMIAKPSLIRRPVVERDGQLMMGFDPTRFDEFFNQ
ncbi:ArsC family reductase [Uliginosibacterium sp. H1]|uniref:ArsC family reductase n=1 Tax=Uliginosibacterium sp. H1 TaxID=3114757 RepID=UPI002E173F23|nr:ArsC family reductase [Uliginosibacterium sp. H1]